MKHEETVTIQSHYGLKYALFSEVSGMLALYPAAGYRSMRYGYRIVARGAPTRADQQMAVVARSSRRSHILEHRLETVIHDYPSIGA